MSKTPPPPLAVIDAGAFSPSPWSSVTIATIIIASAVVISAAVYLLLRHLYKLFRRTAEDDVVQNSNPRQRHVELLNSLPLFSFGSVTGKLNGGDCAVCLSKFEPNHQLRLLPLCCHAFHAGCIDQWIVSNQTCPLCRSIVRASDSAALDKILSNQNLGNSNNFSNGGSFRVELGSISRRREGSAAAEGARRTYSLGSLEYVVDDCVHEVSTDRRGISDVSSNKDLSIAIPEAEAPAPANWLREYLSSISSRTMSFRSSATCFSSSEAAVAPEEDLELNRAGEEISEVFRWISGI